VDHFTVLVPRDSASPTVRARVYSVVKQDGCDSLPLRSEGNRISSSSRVPIGPVAGNTASHAYRGLVVVGWVTLRSLQ
jgi:hypothetical protein